MPDKEIPSPEVLALLLCLHARLDETGKMGLILRPSPASFKPFPADYSLKVC